MKTKKLAKAKMPPQMGGKIGKKMPVDEVPMHKGMPMKRGKKK